MSMELVSTAHARGSKPSPLNHCLLILETIGTEYFVLRVVLADRGNLSFS
jgi:hypothetical protein